MDYGRQASGYHPAPHAHSLGEVLAVCLPHRAWVCAKKILHWQHYLMGTAFPGDKGGWEGAATCAVL